ncbi:hypothetical protein CDAR_545021 [Caerostris darwini]|uniref:Uncharacterized protein n=1 Tax=Caerostris darwini TaxID=1538125 RepID=A0AAV4PU88_9ARAC|nr:hypothetical protein CDAR_545021 [Caerostris darwini]
MAFPVGKIKKKTSTILSPRKCEDISISRTTPQSVPDSSSVPTEWDGWPVYTWIEKMGRSSFEEFFFMKLHMCSEGILYTTLYGNGRVKNIVSCCPPPNQCGGEISARMASRNPPKTVATDARMRKK